MTSEFDHRAQILRVFVSSTGHDLTEHRAAVIAGLSGLDRVKPINQESFGSRAPETVGECERLVRESDIVVVIVAHRYGWVPSEEEGGDGGSSITELEVAAAREAGIPVLAFLVDESPDHQWGGTSEQDALLTAASDDMAALAEIKRRVDRLADFKQALSSRIRSTFTTPDHLSGLVSTSVANEIERLDAERPARDESAPSPTSDMAPGLGVAGGFRDPYHQRLNAFRDLHSELRDREDDLAALQERVQRGGYQLIVAGPWTGKTAVMVHLAERLRVSGATVVEFYVSEKGSDTARDYLPFVITQLLDATRTPGGVALDPSAQAIQLRSLWAAAALAPERLVLMVDGLDEQDQDDPISPLLPTHCSGDSTVLVASRPHPDPANHVGAEHALSQLDRSRRYELEPYGGAQDIAGKARETVAQMLGDEGTRDLIGFLTHARGPLAVGDLAELTDRFPVEVDADLTQLLSHLRATRSIEAEIGYEIGHQTLLAQAEEALGTKGRRIYGEALVAWARTYADAGWPAETPIYLTESLDDMMLADAVGDERVETLRWLTTDDRAEAVRKRTGRLGRILASLDELLTLDPPLGYDERLRLAIHEVELRAQTSAVPPEVAAALAVTGRLDLALEMAWGIADEDHRGAALTAIASAIASDDPDRAVEIVRTVTGGDRRQSIAAVGARARRIEVVEEALAEARADPDEWRSERTAAAVAGQLAQLDPYRALDICRGMAGSFSTTEAIGAVARELSHTDGDAALDLVAEILDAPWVAADALGDIIERSPGLPFESVHSMAASLTPSYRTGVLVRLARRAGDPDLESTTLDEARAISDPSDRDSALFEAASALAVHDADLALSVAAETSAVEWHASSVVEIVSRVVHDQPDLATRLALDLADVRERPRALGVVARELRSPEMATQALTATRVRVDDGWRSWATADLARIVADDDLPGAYGLTDAIPRADLRTRTRGLLAFESGDRAALEAAIERCDEFGGFERDETLAKLLPALATYDPDRAIEIAGTVGSTFHFETLHAMARAAARSDTAKALEIAALHEYEFQTERTSAEMSAEVSVRDRADGLALARDLWSDVDRAIALAFAADALDDASLAGEAVELARANLDSFLSVDDAAIIARLCGSVSLAREILQAPYLSSSGERDVAATIAAHDVDEALAIADQTTVGGGEVLAAIATTIAADDPDRALLIARRIPNDYERASALVAIAGPAGAASSDLVRWLTERWSAIHHS